jgi:hypothetical protein
VAYLRAQWDQILKGQHGLSGRRHHPSKLRGGHLSLSDLEAPQPFEFIDYLNIPWKKSANTLGFFTLELERVKKNLEAFVHEEISSAALKNAIACTTITERC